MFEVEYLVPIITAIIGSATALGVVWYRNYLSKKSKHTDDCKIHKQIQNDQELLDNLEEIRDKFNADRLTILQFHNGGNYYTGKSIQKMSMSYEVAQAGIQRMQDQCQNMPVSSCTTTLMPLFENWCIEYHDVNKDFPASLCKVHQIEAGNKSTYHWGLFDLDKNCIGLMTLDYVKRKRKLKTDDLESLKVKIIKLPGYL